MIGKLYMMCVKHHNCDRNPSLVNLRTTSLDRHGRTDTQDMRWMRKGFPKADFRIVERIADRTFKCTQTEELLEITGRSGFTQKAWNKFITNK